MDGLLCILSQHIQRTKQKMRLHREGYWIFIYIILLIFFEAGKTSRGERCIEEKSWKSDYNV